VLRSDDFQAEVDAIVPGMADKQVAVEILRQAMAGNTDTVTTLLESNVETMFTLGLRVDSWLREGLMYEVLHIEPPADSWFSTGQPGAHRDGENEPNDGTGTATPSSGSASQGIPIIARAAAPVHEDHVHEDGSEALPPHLYGSAAKKAKTKRRHEMIDQGKDNGMSDDQIFEFIRKQAPELLQKNRRSKDLISLKSMMLQYRRRDASR
jgi:hypothetical protein